MPYRPMSAADWMKALIVGLATATVLAAVIVPSIMGGLARFPKPIAQAVAETLLDREVSLAGGMIFHFLFITACSVAIIAILRHRLTLPVALGLGLLLWLVVIFVFAPLSGWGALGMDEAPEFFIASFVPNVLFGPVLWALHRLVFRGRGSESSGPV
ncbi:MAG: hypothetical protein AB7O39_00950 [Flavobacteriaceae bacterium]